MGRVFPGEVAAHAVLLDALPEPAVVPAARGALHDDDNSDEADQAPRGFFGRILDALSQPFRLCDRDIRIGASIGISFGLECSTGDELLREADQAMYRAKLSGRNRTCSEMPHTSYA